ncbi:GNAT family N-acetyltransferase [Lottiidibacillus patelloidae]|uniref:GNAT family N-acetyltransferase n=1 Tax=Lottiidibacillus patelloidae TaxID=2670334 RepID=A0A263BUT3_9BACI|nr:GNAT family N-acetyltransferase [Lottiidibacillus patelloidae]OZM57328.1 GNAT family N-acetyltransferase [Lottiidibacillus patelloidae]
MTLQIVNTNDQKTKNIIKKQLFDYNIKHLSEDLRGRFEEVSLILLDNNENVVGGLLGEICWNWLEIHILMVNEDIRKMGYGTKLLFEAEKIATRKKCDFIKLDTLSFQALDFYEKHGYEVFGEINNVGRDHKHYYLKKDL